MATEAHKPLEYLLDRIPAWIDILQLLSPPSETQHLDPLLLLSEDDPHPPPLTDGSSYSEVSDQHTLDLKNLDASVHPLGPAPAQKRKRNDESGDSRRKRSKTRDDRVLIYDGGAQKQLEIIVEDIGRAIGFIRQAKWAKIRSPTMSPQILALPSYATSSSEPDNNIDEPLDEQTILTQVRSRRRLTSEASSRAKKQTRTTPKADTSLRALDAVDSNLLLDITARSLEAVSDLCEVAAYQLLRHGDCRAEVKAATLELKQIREHNDVQAAGQKEKRKHVISISEEVTTIPAQAKSLPSSMKGFEADVIVRVGVVQTGTIKEKDEEHDEALLSPIRLASRGGSG